MKEDFTELIWLVILATTLCAVMMFTGCSNTVTKVNIPVKCGVDLPSYNCKVSEEGVDECAIKLQQYVLALEKYKKYCN